MKKGISGFTIVELLIVVVVIAILASISIVAYTGIRTRAMAAAIAADINSTEKAMRLYMMSAGYSTWPIDDTLLPGSRSIDEMINTLDGFSGFMSRAPQSTGSEWAYDNDNDSNPKDFPCGDYDDRNRGVNIRIDIADKDLVVAIDKVIDNGDGQLCGKFRWNNTSSGTYYNLDPDSINGSV